MAKRVTIIVPEWPTDHTPTSLFGCKIEAIEDVPEPPIVQEFRVRCVTLPNFVDAYRSTVEIVLNEHYGGPHEWTVTEVTP